MTDNYARPADDSGDNGDATIPFVPEGGYAPTEHIPFAEDTVATPNPWSATAQLDLGDDTDAGTGATSGYANPSASAYTQPAAGQAQADYLQAQARYTQSAYPPAQSNYVQPQVAPRQGYASPQGYAPQQGYAEPSGSADTIGAQNFYQGYPTAPGAPSQAQAWPAVIHDPVNYDYGYGQAPATGPHPNGTISLVLGIVGIAFFQLLSPVAWYLAAKGKREMATYPGRWLPSGTLTAGLVLGIIGTVFLGLALLAFLLFFFFIILAAGA